MFNASWLIMCGMQHGWTTLYANGLDVGCYGEGSFVGMTGVGMPRSLGVMLCGGSLVLLCGDRVVAIGLGVEANCGECHLGWENFFWARLRWLLALGVSYHENICNLYDRVYDHSYCSTS